MSVIVDRTAGPGQWMMEHGANGRWTKRKTHYFNEGSSRPVCDTSIFTSLGKLVVGSFDAGLDIVVNPEGEGFRVPCGHCVSIVVHGVDLKAAHARKVLAGEV